MPDTISTIKGLEQDRASFAYRCAELASRLNEKQRKEYKSYVKKLPMYIKTNGLGASLAFALSKTETWQKVYYDIETWLRQPHKKYLLNNDLSTGLASKVIQLESQEYRAVTVEVLAFLNWLRRFAEGLIDGDVENQD